jgi:hypothetical protein
LRGHTGCLCACAECAGACAGSGGPKGACAGGLVGRSAKAKARVLRILIGPKHHHIRASLSKSRREGAMEALLQGERTGGAETEGGERERDDGEEGDDCAEAALKLSMGCDNCDIDWGQGAVLLGKQVHIIVGRQL